MHATDLIGCNAGSHPPFRVGFLIIREECGESCGARSATSASAGVAQVKHQVGASAPTLKHRNSA